MKKRNLFVTVILALALSLTVLAACGDTPDNGGGGNADPTPEPTPAPTATYDADAVLSALQGNLAVNATLETTVVNTADSSVVSSTTTGTNTYIAADEYYIASVDGDNTNVAGHYFKNAAGNVSQKTVDKNNAVTETEVKFSTGESTSAPREFAKTYSNPFSFVTTAAFTQNEKEVTVNAKAAAGETTFGVVLDAMFITRAEEARDIVVVLDDDYKPVSLKFVVNRQVTDNGKNYECTYKFTGNFVTKADIAVPSYPYPAEGDKTLLTQAFTKLKANNYSYTLYSSAVNEGKTPHSTGVVAPVGVLNTDNVRQVTSGFINDPTTGKLVEVEANDGKLNGTASELGDKTLADKFTKFDFSVDVFRQVSKNKFVLRDGEFDLADLLPDAMCGTTYTFCTSSVVFEVAEDLSTVTYSYDFRFINSGTITVVLSNIGTTEFGYDISTDYVAYDPNPATKSWTAVNNGGNGLNEFAELFPGKNIDECIPFYNTEEGSFTSFGSWGDAFEIIITYPGDSAGFDVYDYSDALKAAGWANEFGSDDYTNSTLGMKITVTGGADMLTGKYTVTISITALTA